MKLLVTEKANDVCLYIIYGNAWLCQAICQAMELGATGKLKQSD